MGSHRSLKLRLFLAGVAVLLAAGCLALSFWQIERREWKHALIAAVDDRVAQSPVPVPAEPEWARLTAEKDAYRKVTVSGHFQHDKEVLVQAVTDLGAGFWVMTPLETPQFTVWVNRGYVATGKPEQAVRAGAGAGNSAGQPMATITGLLRMTEPDGAFLRKNAPAEGKWYSRDVAAMTAQKGLMLAAPFFIDADASSDFSFPANPPSMGPAEVQAYPVGGLTVIKFADNHLVYAVTWFALALLSGAAAWLVLADGRMRRNKA